MQHVRIAKYRVQSGTLAEISDADAQGVQGAARLRQLRSRRLGRWDLLSISHWETHDEAEAAASAARGWVAANLADKIELIENHTGDYAFLS